MKNILITGISGFIGNAIYENLKKSHNVYGISRTNKNKIEEIKILDLSEKGNGVGFLKENQFDVIIHLATNLANPNNINDLNVFGKNMQIHMNLIEGMKNYENCHLINFSSSAVYPGISGTFRETDEINPSVNNDCLYGLSKFNSEMFFRYFLPKSIKQLHLRVGFVYGEQMDPSRIHQKFKQELSENNCITVFGNGERTLPQIEIGSLVNKISFFIDNCTSGTLNVADENISLADLAKRTIDKYGNPQSNIIYKQEGNSNRFKLSLEKINHLFNA